MRRAMLAVVVLGAACGHKAAPDAHVDKVEKPAPPGPGSARPVDPVEDYEEVESEPPELGSEGDDADSGPVVESKGERAVLARALDTFANMRSSTYSHRTKIDAVRGHYELDCSGFVDYVLAGANPRAFEELRAATVKRPLARHFVEFFQLLGTRSGSAWHAVARPSELAPGDIVAWLKPADVTSRNTGHVMIVREAPHVDDKRSDVWVVPIIDSTGVPHGKGDSRKQSRATGLGTGEVLVVVDARGVPIGYRWSRGKKAKIHETTIAFARVR